MKGMFGALAGMIFSLRCKWKVIDISQGMSVGNSPFHIPMYKLGLLFLCIFPCLYIILALPNIVIKELSCGILFHHVSGNTAMVYHDGRVLALNEADKPCKIF